MIKKELLSDFEYFDLNNQKLIIWKSFDRLEESLSGGTDFDLLLVQGDGDILLGLLEERGWTKFIAEKWRRFRNIHDYFKVFLDEEGKSVIIHFHVHEVVRTGQRFTKSLEINNELFMDQLTIKNGFETVREGFDLEMKVVRASYKLTILDLVLSFLRFNSDSIYKYRKEILRSSKESVKGLSSELFSEYFSTKSTLKFLYANMKIRNRYKEFKIKKLLKNYYFKLIYSKISSGGKFPNKGFLFSFIGVDGSGKTTMIENVDALLSNQIKIKTIYMGIPKSIKTIRSRLYKIKTVFIKESSESKTGEDEPKIFSEKRFINTIFSLIVSIIKTFKILQIYAYKKLNYIVITDRYPMEGIADDLPQWKNSYFRKYEMKINKLFIKPDKIFLLYANLEVLKLRRFDNYQNQYQTRIKNQDGLLAMLEKDPLIVKIDNTSNFKDNEFEIINKVFEKVRNDS